MTFNAGCAGMPVWSESQTPQTMTAPPVKNSKVNQSINAAILRLNVGIAKAAKAAMLGNASNSVFSGALVNRLAMRVAVNMNEGKIKC